MIILISTGTQPPHKAVSKQLSKIEYLSSNLVRKIQPEQKSWP
jgi:hypothetical protein